MTFTELHQQLARRVAPVIILAAGFALSAPAVSAVIVIEDFETGAYGPEWSLAGDAVSASNAKDGDFGSGDVDWTYRTDFELKLGDRLQMWARPSTSSGGRFYFGFGADASGASSFVLAPNTGDIHFQNNTGFGFSQLNNSDQSFVPDNWYLAEIFFDTGGNIVGSLYDSDGETLLNSLVADGASNSLGGIALRSFGNWSFDSLRVLRDQGVQVAVAEPAIQALFGLGLGLLIVVRAFGGQRVEDW